MHYWLWFVTASAGVRSVGAVAIRLLIALRARKEDLPKIAEALAHRRN